MKGSIPPQISLIEEILLLLGITLSTACEDSCWNGSFQR